MDANTSLPEVAALLPQQAASVLAGKSPEIQSAVVTTLRSTFIYWERHRMALDPVQYEVVVNGLVFQLIADLESMHAFYEHTNRLLTQERVQRCAPTCEHDRHEQPRHT